MFMSYMLYKTMGHSQKLESYNGKHKSKLMGQLRCSHKTAGILESGTICGCHGFSQIRRAEQLAQGCKVQSLPACHWRQELEARHKPCSPQLQEDSEVPFVIQHTSLLVLFKAVAKLLTSHGDEIMESLMWKRCNCQRGKHDDYSIFYRFTKGNKCAWFTTPLAPNFLSILILLFNILSIFVKEQNC